MLSDERLRQAFSVILFTGFVSSLIGALVVATYKLFTISIILVFAACWFWIISNKDLLSEKSEVDE